MSGLEDKMEKVDERTILEFQRWAVSCAHVLEKSGKMPKEDYEELRKATIERKPLEIGFFTKYFKRATSEVMKRGGWTWKNVREYFTEGHNALVAQDPWDWGFKESCMEHDGTVVVREGDWGVVEYEADKLLPLEYQGRKRRDVQFAYLPEANVGDRVLIHWKDVVGFKDEKE